MRIIEVVQGSPEWLSARCGMPSASNFDKIITPDGKPSRSKEKYLYQCAGERITCHAEETYQSGEMLRGVEMEAEARQAYEFITGEVVTQVGLCIVDGYCASPDGMVGEDGLLEIKCPMIATHVSYLLANKLPDEYFCQVQGQLLVTGRKWVDFFSYFPGIKPLLLRIKPDKKFQTELKTALNNFCSELNEVVNQLRGKHD